MKKIISPVFYGNLFVSACASALCIETLVRLHLPLPQPYLLFVFFSTLLLYNMQRLLLSSDYALEDADSRRGWIYGHQKIIALICGMALVGELAILRTFSLRFLGAFLMLGLFSTAYFLPGLSWRHFRWLKAAMVAFVWTVATEVAPCLMGGGLRMAANNWGYAAERFFFMLALCMAFNIRDIEYDAQSGVSTMATHWGIQKTKCYAALVLLMGFSCFAVALWGHASKPALIGILATYLASFAVVGAIKTNSGELYYLFGIDGLMLLHALLMALTFSMPQ